MFTLSDPIENEIYYCGKNFFLDLAFDNVLRVFELQKEELFTDHEKLELSLKILVVNIQALRDLTVQQKIVLLREIFDQFITMSAKSVGTEEKVFDFIQDAKYIFASFYMDYGIDLIEQQGKLHWWKFISLFQGLSEKTKIQEIMQIRSKKIPKANKYNQDEIQNVLKLKRYYALEKSQKEQEEQFERALNRLADSLERRAVKNEYKNGRISSKAGQISG